MKFSIIFGIIFSGSLDCSSNPLSAHSVFHSVAQNNVSTMVGERDKLNSYNEHLNQI